MHISDKMSSTLNESSFNINDRKQSLAHNVNNGFKSMYITSNHHSFSHEMIYNDTDMNSFKIHFEKYNEKRKSTILDVQGSGAAAKVDDKFTTISTQFDETPLFLKQNHDLMGGNSPEKKQLRRTKSFTGSLSFDESMGSYQNGGSPDSPRSKKKHFPLNYRRYLSDKRPAETIEEVENDHESHQS